MKKQYMCTNCGETFKRKWNAGRHIRRVHDGVGQLALVTGTKVKDKDPHQPVNTNYQPYVIPPKYYYDSIHPRPPRIPEHEKGPKPSSALIDPVEYAVKLGTIAENIEKVNRLQQSKAFPWTAYPYYYSPAPVPPTEFIVGYVCSSCLTRDIIALPQTNIGYDFRHTCNANHLLSAQSVTDKGKALERLNSSFPESIKSKVDIWLQGQPKYLVANLIRSADILKSLPFLRKLGLEPNNGGEGNNQYIYRAIRASENNAATLMDEAETFDFLKKAGASAAVYSFSIKDSANGRDFSRDYLVRIVPPHEIPTNTAIKETLKDRTDLSSRVVSPGDRQQESKNSSRRMTVSGPATSEEQVPETPPAATALPTGNFYVLQDPQPILDSHVDDIANHKNDRKYLYYLFLRISNSRRNVRKCWRFGTELINANREGGLVLQGRIVKDDVVKSLEDRLNSAPIYPIVEVHQAGCIAHGKDVKVGEPAPIVWDTGIFLLESVGRDNIAITIISDKLNGRYRLVQDPEGVWLFSKQVTRK